MTGRVTACGRVTAWRRVTLTACGRVRQRSVRVCEKVYVEVENHLFIYDLYFHSAAKERSPALPPGRLIMYRVSRIMYNV